MYTQNIFLINFFFHHHHHHRKYQHQGAFIKKDPSVWLFTWASLQVVHDALNVIYVLHQSQLYRPAVCVSVWLFKDFTLILFCFNVRLMHSPGWTDRKDQVSFSPNIMYTPSHLFLISKYQSCTFTLLIMCHSVTINWKIMYLFPWCSLCPRIETGSLWFIGGHFYRAICHIRQARFSLSPYTTRCLLYRQFFFSFKTRVSCQNGFMVY